MSTEINKNRKYSKIEMSSIIKKVDNIDDINNLLLKTIDVVNAIKNKHL